MRSGDLNNSHSIGEIRDDWKPSPANTNLSSASGRCCRKKARDFRRSMILFRLIRSAAEAGHDGSANRRSAAALLLFNLEDRIPADHLLRRINPIVTRVLADLREKLASFYSAVGRPSIDPELMM
jgi:hypothetical protein